MTEKTQEIGRGMRAQQLLDDPLLAETLATLRRQYIEEWAATKSEDTDGRERLYRAVQVTEEFVRHLRIAAENGKLAAAQLEKMRGKQRA